MRLCCGGRLDGLLHSNPATLIQFPKVRDHPLPRTACRAIRLHKGPIGVSLPVLRSVAAPHIHGAHPTDLRPTCKRVGLHYTTLLRPSCTTPSTLPCKQSLFHLPALKRVTQSSHNFLGFG